MKPDKDRMMQHIADHTLWFSSGGMSGCRGDVSNCDLSDLTEEDMAGMTLDSIYHNENTIFPNWMENL